jgi:hypothetical protein
VIAKVRPRRRRAEPAIPHYVNAIGRPPGNEAKYILGRHQVDCGISPEANSLPRDVQFVFAEKLAQAPSTRTASATSLLAARNATSIFLGHRTSRY